MAFPMASDRLEALFGAPGACWTPDDTEEVLDWVFSGARLRYLVTTAAYRGAGSFADAEDACQEFASLHFQEIVRYYDPARGLGFGSWLTFCLCRWCGRRGARARRLTEIVRRHVHSALKHRTIDRGDPESLLIRREANLSVRRAVLSLTSANRKLLTMQYWDDASADQRASALGQALGTVRVRSHRARRSLASHPEIQAARVALGV